MDGRRIDVTTTFKWLAPEAIATALSGATLQNLASGSFSAASSAIANETDLYPYIDLELYLDALSPTAGAFCDVWIEYTMDTTNYADHGISLQTASLLCTFQLGVTAATAQRIIRSNVLIAPLGFKLALRNMAGVNIPNNTSSFLKYRRHFDQGV